MIGIMQGRLSPPIDQKIQAFPNKFWKAEFFIAEALGFDCIEWTLDFEDIYLNPIICNPKVVLEIKNSTNVDIPSLTYDVAMQNPLVVDKLEVVSQTTLLALVLKKIREVGVNILVLPLIDGSSVEDRRCQDIYVEILQTIANRSLDYDLKIAIESDFNPEKLKNFISEIDSPFVGINYDTGNSASNGFQFEKEMSFLKSNIFNVHIKDRIFQGTTVPLGQGNSPLKTQFEFFKNNLPDVNLILQTARSAEGDDVGVAKKYLQFLKTGTLL